MATDNPTATPSPEGAIMSSGDQPRKALDLMDEIDKKLAPAATRPPEGEPGEPENFGAVDARFMSLRCRLEVLKDALGDCENVPNELAAAAFAFSETVEELVRWHGDLQDWHMAHEHTPKAPKEVQIMSTDNLLGEVSKVIDLAEKQMKEVEEMETIKTLAEGLEEVPVNGLTKAQVDEVCAELLAKGEAHLAGELREYWARTHPDETMQSP